MQGERIQLMEFMLAYTPIKEADYWKLKRAFSLVECRRQHGLTIEAFTSILLELLLEAETLAGKITKPAGAATFIECFNYEESLNSLQFWFNDKTNNTRIVQKVFKSCILCKGE